MAVGLTTEQVVALAPDAGAVKAGRGLATPRPWRTLGRSERAAWGECQGSAAQPYQVQADLAEPAFKCSCPSKKLPCKHALGLLLLLAEQPAALPPVEPPDWVGDWLAARARRAEQRTARVERPAAETTTETTAAEAAKRAASREKRVAAGLAELEQWLADLLRRGLASAQAEPARFWERPATRLVDAQAPGLARRVRELAGIPATGDGWQARLLERLATLHLLVEGYRRLEALPPATQADIRAQIGWTVREEEVLAGEATRDRWLVLGGRDEIEERLRVRRTWLWGAASDRPALLLQFAHGSQPFEVALPAGLAIDAELAFFPGAYPLRALIKARHDSAHQLDGLPGHATLAEATAAYADAAGGQSVAGGVPAGGARRAADPGGRSLDRARRRGPGAAARAAFRRRLDAAGAERRPPDRPVRRVGRRCPAAARRLGRRPVRQPVAGERRDERVGGIADGCRRRHGAQAAGAGGGDPAGWARSSLAWPGATRQRRCSALPPRRRSTRGPVACRRSTVAHCRLPARPTSVPPAAPAPPSGSARCCAGRSIEVLPEWLAALAVAGQRVRDDALPALLEHGRGEADAREAILPVLGERGRWLAAQNPDWGWAVGAVDDEEAIWQTGERAARELLVRRLRRTEPARARDLVAATWTEEPPTTRAAFLEAFEVGLSLADEPFLEAALDDRRKEVRTVAARLLARLPESGLARRMVERVEPLLRIAPGEQRALLALKVGRKARISVSLPAACDKSMTRDGVEPKPPYGVGEKTWWLRQMAAAIPPSHWTRTSGESVAALLEAAQANQQWKATLLTAWTQAAESYRDAEWAEAMLLTLKEPPVAVLPILPPERQEAIVLRVLEQHPGPLRESHPALDLLAHFEHALSPAFARAALTRVRQHLVSAKPNASADWALRDIVRTLMGRLLPPSLADEAATGWPEMTPGGYWQAAIDEMLSLLCFRHDMLKEIAE